MNIYSIIVAILIGAIGVHGTTAQAQSSSACPPPAPYTGQNERACENVLAQAISSYEESQFREVIRLFRQNSCSPHAFRPESENRLETFRILIDSWVNEENLEVASCYAQQLVDERPSYVASNDQFGSSQYQDIFQNLFPSTDELMNGAQRVPDESLPGTISLARPRVVPAGTTLRILFPPEGLHATASDSTVKLTWRKGITATRYRVHRWQEGHDSEDTVHFDTFDTTFVDTPVFNGTRYYYQVSGMNDIAWSNGIGYEDAPKSDTVSALPLGPFTLLGRARDQQAELFWTQWEGASVVFGGPDTVRIYRGNFPDFSIEEGEEIAQIVNDTTFFDNGPLENGEAVYYRASRQADDGRSVVTNVVSIQPAAISPVLTELTQRYPGTTPTPDDSLVYAVFVTDADENLDRDLTYLYWSDDSDQIEKNVPMLPEGDGHFVGTIPAGLRPGSGYAVWTTAQDANGNAAESARLSVGVRPAVPFVTAEARDGRVQLTWDPVAGAERYHIYRDEATVPIVVVDTTWADVDVLNGIRYTYQVTALNRYGEGPPGHTGPLIPVGSLTLIALPGDEQVSLEWTGIEEAPEARYRVLRSADALPENSMIIARDRPAGEPWVDADTALVNDQEYCYWVQTESINDPRRSSGKCVIPRAKAPVLGAMVAELDPPPSPSDSVRVEIQATDEDGNIDRVQINWRVNPTGSVTMQPMDEDPSMFVGYLPPQRGGQTVWFAIRAVDAKGRSVISEERHYEVKLARPNNIASSGQDGRVILYIDPVDGAVGYEVYRQTINDEERLVTVADAVVEEESGFTQWIDTLVKNNVRYIYRIRAISATGLKSAYSDPVEEIPGIYKLSPGGLAPTDTTSHFRVKPGDESATIRWAFRGLYASIPGPFSIYRRQALYHDRTLVATTRLRGHTDPTLENGTLYYYQIEAEVDGEIVRTVERPVRPFAIPPHIDLLSDIPDPIAPDEPLELLVDVVDPDNNVDSSSVYLHVESDSTFRIPFSPFEGGGYVGVVPPHLADTDVRISIEAMDAKGNALDSTLHAYVVVPAGPEKFAARMDSLPVLSWMPVDGAGWYQVYRDTVRIGSEVRGRFPQVIDDIRPCGAGDGADTCFRQDGERIVFNDIALSDERGKRYYYRVAAGNRGGAGRWSKQAAIGKRTRGIPLRYFAVGAGATAVGVAAYLLFKGDDMSSLPDAPPPRPGSSSPH